MNNTLLFDEPELEFQFNQRVKDPRHGLSLFGAYDANSASGPGSVSYIVLGTEEGQAKFHAWAREMNQPALSAPKDNYRLWVPFPGFEAAFQSEFPEIPVWSGNIDSDALSKASHLNDEHERSFEVVNLYMNELDKSSKLDDKIGVAICVVPDEVWKNCRPESKVKSGLGYKIPAKEKHARRGGQQSLFEEYNIEQYSLSPDFRRQLKARGMKQEVPIQIIRESALRIGDDHNYGDRLLTPYSDRKWNLSTTMYYKCGGKPWRLVSARDGVCYIGIAFRRTGKDDKSKTACCAAQMFLNTGDGVVFLGEYGPWYSPDENQFHLNESKAHALLDGILKTYKDLGGKELTEIFLHCRSDINGDEFSGYQKACPAGVKLTGVRVQPERNGFRLFRNGRMPVVRGTFVRLNQRSGFLLCNGFKPSIATYDGWETPVPLRIDIQYGDTPIERVAQDILGLTKLNYNACHLGDGQPVTVGFSDAVGEILISNPTVPNRRPNFKYYI